MADGCNVLSCRLRAAFLKAILFIVMSFRKNTKDERDERLKWNRFCDANKDLIQQIGLTTPTIETDERFIDFLMHGYIDHHDDWSKYTVSKMDAEQYKLFKLLIDKYFEAGYYDPSLMAVSHEETIEFARKYPKQFHSSFVEIIERQDEKDA